MSSIFDDSSSSSSFDSDEVTPTEQVLLKVQARVILITGASRGLGLGLVKQFSKSHPDDTILACARDPKTAKELQQLQEEHPNTIHIVPLDVNDEKSIKSAYTYVTDTLKIRQVHILINNAGIASPNHPHDPLLSAQKAVMLHIYSVNVIGPLLVFQTFYPLIKHAELPAPLRADGHQLQTFSASKPLIVNISSNLASLENNTWGTCVSYRCSKAALNMLTKTMAVECEDVYFMALSPGWVDTDMGSAGDRSPPLSVEESCSSMFKVISHFTADKNGKFVEYDGSIIPW